MNVTAVRYISVYNCNDVTFLTNPIDIYAAFRTYAHCTKLMGASIIWTSSLQTIWFVHIPLNIHTRRPFGKPFKLHSYFRTNCWWISKHHTLFLCSISSIPIKLDHGCWLTKSYAPFSGTNFCCYRSLACISGSKQRCNSKRTI